MMHLQGNYFWCSPQNKPNPFIIVHKYNIFYEKKTQNKLILHFEISEYKRYRSHIKKKSDQVLRLRKKAKKDVRGSNPGASLTDPSVQRLIEQTSRDLNNHYKQLSDHEKKCLRRILTEERHRYCNLVASLVCFICNPSTKSK